MTAYVTYWCIFTAAKNTSQNWYSSKVSDVKVMSNNKVELVGKSSLSSMIHQDFNRWTICFNRSLELEFSTAKNLRLSKLWWCPLSCPALTFRIRHLTASTLSHQVNLDPLPRSIWSVVKCLGTLDEDSGNLGSISSTFYEQLLHLQIPNAQKTVKLSAFFALSGSLHVKAVHKMLVQLAPCVYKSTFYACLFHMKVFWTAFL